MIQTDIAVIGAGLTGLTIAHTLKREGRQVMLIEQADRVGGQIHTFEEAGFVFESGPNTGVVSHPEVAELFASLAGDCRLVTAREESKRRLIWKGSKFRALPSGLMSAVATPLFSLKDKFRILGEPWRAKGTDPDESVGALAARRLGKSFLDYAVDPFLSGVYAGDPMKLVTRYAMPKLYNLEQSHGSFIRGAIAKAKEPKTDRDRLATKKVFSAEGGLSSLTTAMSKAIGSESICLGARDATVQPVAGGWRITAVTADGLLEIEAKKVVTTVGAYALPSLLPFVEPGEMQKISNLVYAPIVQVSVGVKDTGKLQFNAFGGLVPSCEKKNVLGILFPSGCFGGRAPEGGALFSFFIGGVKHPEVLHYSDEQLHELVIDAFHHMLKFSTDRKPDIVKIFRHARAIPQYGKDSGDRFAAIERIQQQHSGLIIAGNLRNGIGMADRIKQGAMVARRLACG